LAQQTSLAWRTVFPSCYLDNAHARNAQVDQAAIIANLTISN